MDTPELSMILTISRLLRLLENIQFSIKFHLKIFLKGCISLEQIN